MANSETLKRRDLLIAASLFLLGAALRLAALPLSAIDTGDAVSRVLIAQRWLLSPELITHGVWLPLHTYLIAFAVWLWPDPIAAPAIQSALFGAATAVPLYLFTKREFGNRGAFFVGVAATLYPVSFRYSLMPVSEVPFAFFVALAIWLLGEVRAGGGPGWAVAAGLSMTAASMLRYEGWVLIPLLGVLLLWRPVLLVTFGATASLFPILWMFGCWLATGDPLYGPHYATHWQVEVEGINQGVGAREMVGRVAFFPLALFWGLTPVVSLLCAAGVGAAALERRHWLYLVPLLGLLAVDVTKAMDGSLILRTRYSLVLGVMLLPFAAVALRRIDDRVARSLVCAVALLSIIPFSYADRFFAPRKIEPIARMDDPSRQVAEVVRNALDSDADALLIDFFGWSRTYYVIQQSGVHPNRYFVVQGVDAPIDADRLRAVLDANRRGVLVLAEGVLAAELGEVRDGSLRYAGKRIALERLEDVGGVRVYRFRVD